MVVESFASNTTVAAIANLGGVIGLIVIIWKMSGFAIRFSRDAYNSNIKTTIRKHRRQNISFAYHCSYDSALYISFLSRVAVYIISLLCLIIINANLDFDPSSELDYNSYKPIVKFSYEKYLLISRVMGIFPILMSLTMLSMILVQCLKVYLVGNIVHKFRVKVINRRYDEMIFSRDEANNRYNLLE